MSWADLAGQYPVYFGVMGCVLAATLLYGLDTVRHAILSRYNLEIAAQRTTQEAYLVEQLTPMFAEHSSLSLADPIQRIALARAVANYLVKE
jgi:hypothetical protein